MDMVVTGIWGVIFLIFIIKVFQSIRLVSTQTAHIVERLGRYRKTLEAGFHLLIPFVDKVTYVQDLREEAIDVPPQECFTSDEVKVTVDGVIYIQITDPIKACYGIVDYRDAAVQLAKTTTRSVIGTLPLDRTFEERDLISAKVVEVLDQAGNIWGIRVHRYEIKNITPPTTVRNAMEKQVTAERDRRAILAASEGERQSNISEGEMQRRINEAEGQAEEILAIARATAESITKIAAVTREEGGTEALKLQMNERYVNTIRNLENARIILPANVLELKSWLDNLHLNELLDSDQYDSTVSDSGDNPA